MDNASFIELRNLVQSNPSDDKRSLALKRSFYSNGCTMLPGAVLSDAVWNACAQHNFRYTVGPRVYASSFVEAEAERLSADEQLGGNIAAQQVSPDLLSSVHGRLHQEGTSAFASSFFIGAPANGAEIFSSLEQVRAPQHPAVHDAG
ncbi:hypothetical protein ABZ721_23860 [Streptomyces sp. NPDC006733]|uniref:hypothetical protein n=1 Tax=Streptomyces sp. NPDC006733 TaxID=3155460 RepID=UPI00340DBF1F